jgi:signal recognition particle receptor subunit beta
MMYSGLVPVVNPLARELVFKIVYYGPGLGGKTTTLQHIYATTRPEHRGRMVSLATPVDRTLYFDFLPIRVPNIRDMGVRLQLFTVPGQVYYNATRKLVLTGADGVVFVADSQRLRMDANLESWENLRDNLREHGRILAELPHVFEFNKRDLPELVDTSELDLALNRHQVPAFATVAIRGVGVYEALEAITRAVLADFEGRMPGEQERLAHDLQVPEGGLAEALRGADRGADEEPKCPPAAPNPLPPAEPEMTPSGMFQLALAVDLDAGENAARVLTDGMRASEQRFASPPDAPSRAAESGKVPPATGLPSGTEGTPAGGSAGPAALPDRAVGVGVDLSEDTANEPIALSRPRTQRPEVAALVTPGASFAALWPLAERTLVLELEMALGAQDYSRTVRVAEKLVARVLASAASMLGSTVEAPRDPALMALLLGVPGPRVLEFRWVVREARAGREISQQAALAAYVFAIELNLAKARIAG